MTVFYVWLVVIILAPNIAWYMAMGHRGMKWNWRIAVYAVLPYLRWTQANGWCYFSERYETPDTLCTEHQGMKDLEDRIQSLKGGSP